MQGGGKSSAVAAFSSDGDAASDQTTPCLHVRDSEELLAEGHVSQRKDALRRAEDFTSTTLQQKLGCVK